MNTELCRLALEKVGNPNILINMVSRRVRQLNQGGPAGRVMVKNVTNWGVADIALKEIVEGKIDYESDLAGSSEVSAAELGTL